MTALRLQNIPKIRYAKMPLLVYFLTHTITVYLQNNRYRFLNHFSK